MALYGWLMVTLRNVLALMLSNMLYRNMAIYQTPSLHTYQEDGHYFYVLNFTMPIRLWVYDIGENEWHERADFDSSTGLFKKTGHKTTYLFFNKHLVADYENGNLYEQKFEYLYK